MPELKIKGGNTYEFKVTEDMETIEVSGHGVSIMRIFPEGFIVVYTNGLKYLGVDSIRVEKDRQFISNIII